MIPERPEIHQILKTLVLPTGLGEINTWQDTSKAKISKIVFIFLVQVRKHCHEFTWFLQVFNFQKWHLSRAELGDYGVEELSSLLHHASVSPYFSDEEKEAVVSQWLTASLGLKSSSLGPSCIIIS
jgi:hypothetical protein